MNKSSQSCLHHNFLVFFAKCFLITKDRNVTEQPICGGSSTRLLPSAARRSALWRGQCRRSSRYTPACNDRPTNNDCVIICSVSIYDTNSAKLQRGSRLYVLMLLFCTIKICTGDVICVDDYVVWMQPAQQPKSATKVKVVVPPWNVNGLNFWLGEYQNSVIEPLYCLSFRYMACIAGSVAKAAVICWWPSEKQLPWDVLMMMVWHPAH